MLTSNILIMAMLIMVSVVVDVTEKHEKKILKKDGWEF